MSWSVLRPRGLLLVALRPAGFGCFSCAYASTVGCAASARERPSRVRAACAAASISAHSRGEPVTEPKAITPAAIAAAGASGAAAGGEAGAGVGGVGEGERGDRRRGGVAADEDRARLRPADLGRPVALPGLGPRPLHARPPAPWIIRSWPAQYGALTSRREIFPTGGFGRGGRISRDFGAFNGAS